jgi:site-specific recombinase XerC
MTRNGRSRTSASDATGASVGDLADLSASFRRTCGLAKRPRVVETDLEAVDQLGAFLIERGMPTDVANIRREHVEEYLVDLQNRGRKRATLSNRFRVLQQFFKVLVDEGEMSASPIARMS